MNRFLAIVLAIAAPLIAHAADDVITIRLSYKIVLSPGSLARPMNSGFPVNDSSIDSSINTMNDMLKSYGRGYRLARVDPIFEVGNGSAARPDPSAFFNTNFFDANSGNSWKDDMEADALAHRQM